MADLKKRRLTVVSDTGTDILEREREREQEREKEGYFTPPPEMNHHTNPMYEKLLNFKEREKKKRFTVEDLLKWC